MGTHDLGAVGIGYLERLVLVEGDGDAGASGEYLRAGHC